MQGETRSNTPSKERKFFAYDQEGDGFIYFSNEKERDEFAKGSIQEYLQDGWGEGVDGIMTGTITSIATETNVKHRKDQKFDEEGCDEEGAYWEKGCDCMCNYELINLDKL